MAVSRYEAIETAQAPAPAAPLFDAKWLIIGGAVLLVAWLALVPLVFLVWQSFMTPQTASVAAEFTLQNYIDAYTSSETSLLFGNSLLFATGTASISLVIGTLFAWMNERTNTPFKSMFFAISIVPIVVPGVLFTVAW